MAPLPPLHCRGARLLRRRAFTLVEMLVVITIIGIITAILVPTMKDFGRGSSLKSGGNLVANLASLARQNAMSKNTMTALVLMTEQGTTDDYRAFTLMEYVPNIGWSQTGTWELLPQGIIVDYSQPDDSNFLDNHTSSPLPRFLSNEAEPQLVYNQQPVTTSSMAVRVFMPTGRLRNGEYPAQLRLVEGARVNSTFQYSRRTPEGGPANWYDVAIIGATGATKISRP